MALQYSQGVVNAKMDAIETTISTAPLFRLYTGSVPATCATAASGTQLCSFALPSDWLGTSSAGVKSKAGTWSGSGSAAGTAGYFRILDAAGTTCHMQGTADTSGTDVILDNAVIAVSQTITVNTFTLTGANQ